MVQKVLFNVEECNFFKEFTHRQDVIKTSKPARGNWNTTVTVVPPEEIPVWFKEKLKFFNIKDFSFVNNLAVSRAVVVNHYETNAYFKRHRDNYAAQDHWKNRYKTLIIQLSEDSSYQGGDLIVEDITIDRTIGNVAFFNASSYHELTTITKGSRYSLVMFLDRDDIEEKRSIL